MSSPQHTTIYILLYIIIIIYNNLMKITRHFVGTIALVVLMASFHDDTLPSLKCLVSGARETTMIMCTHPSLYTSTVFTFCVK